MTKFSREDLARCSFRTASNVFFHSIPSLKCPFKLIRVIMVSLEHEQRNFHYEYDFNIFFLTKRIQNSQLKETSAYNEKDIPDQTG